ncbi:MAG: hypothetical protein WCA78_15690 [Rhizomicrobium sp.]
MDDLDSILSAPLSGLGIGSVDTSSLDASFEADALPTETEVASEADLGSGQIGTGLSALATGAGGLLQTGLAALGLASPLQTVSASAPATVATSSAIPLWLIIAVAGIAVIVLVRRK